MTFSALEVPKTRNKHTHSMGNVFSLSSEPVQSSFWQKVLHYFVPYEQTVEYSRTSSPSSSRSSSRVSSHGSSFSFEDGVRPRRKLDVYDSDGARGPNKIRKLDLSERTDNLKAKIAANNIQTIKDVKPSSGFNFSNISINVPKRNNNKLLSGIRLSKYGKLSKESGHKNDSNDEMWKSLSLIHHNKDDKVSSLKKDLSHLDRDPMNFKKFDAIDAKYKDTVSKNTVLRNTVSENNNSERDDDDDVIFVRERKIPVYEKLNKKYRDRLVFDKTYFELVYKKYLEVCKDQKKERDNLLSSKLVSKETILPKLSEKQMANIKKEFSKGTRSSERLSNRFKIDIYNTDFVTLRPGQWLNSNIIEYFLKTLEDADENLVAFSPFFITKLSSDGFNSVRRWLKMKKKDIMKLDKMLIPINLNENHWVCSMVDFRNKKILYLDSMCNTNSRSSFIYLERIKDYVIKQSDSRIGDDFDLIHLPCPQQNNGFDCGIFVLMNLVQLAKDMPFVLKQEDASAFRYYVANEILEHRL